jgi:hypothetical protein
MKYSASLYSTALLVASASAFKVDFWGGSNCAGEELGQWVGGANQGCQQLYAGEAEGATVESTGSVDDGSVVSFYSSSNCDISTAVGESDQGCVGTYHIRNPMQT